jgi:hypothetical protein
MHKGSAPVCLLYAAAWFPRGRFIDERSEIAAVLARA